MAGSWSFILTDAGGAALAELSTATSRSISLKRNSYTEVQLTLSHEDDAAGLLLGALGNTGVPKIRGYRRSSNDPPGQPAPVRFRGYLAALQEIVEETSLLNATFRSPFGVLTGDGDKNGRFVQGQFDLIYNAMDAGTIGKSLIDIANADSPTGLATDASLIVATKVRDRQYPVGQNVGAGVQELTSVLDGFDFYETFVDGPGTVDANFNVVPSLGQVNSNVRFEYGPRTLSNVRSMDRTTVPPMNCVFVTGGNGLTSTYVDAGSVAKYGKWWGKFDFSTMIDQGMLDDKAKGLCRSMPVKTVTFVPELGLDNCPKPWEDWNLGDTVPLYATRAALSENTLIRINGFTVPIDENGNETAVMSDVTKPEEDAMLRASLIAEVVV